jgi:pyocin large subunit-like protein
MSFDAMRWAMRQRLEPVTRLVLLGLADRADKRGLAWPSVMYLAESCGFHRTTVQRELRRLIRLGLIEDSGQRKGLTHQVRVWHLRLNEDGLPLPKPRRAKGSSIGDTLNGMKGLHGLDALSSGAKGSTGAALPEGSKGSTAEKRLHGTPKGSAAEKRLHSCATVAHGSIKGSTPAALNQLETIGAGGRAQARAGAQAPARTGAREARVFEVAADWQPPTLPSGSKAREFVEHWSPAELGRHVRQFRRQAKAEGVGADLTKAWQAHVWRIEREGG